MIRALSSSELQWFLAQHYTFIGHSDPRGFAHWAVGSLRDADAEAAKSFVLMDASPKAGAHVRAPEPDEDDQNLYLSNVWFSDDPADLETLLRDLLRTHPHEAAHYPLHGLLEGTVARLEPVFTSLEFRLQTARDLRFSLSELPPLGVPLLLEAWTEENDAGFADVFRLAEGRAPSDEAWAYLKRRRGPFRPDLWFIARETLDQPPVGYAFYGLLDEGLVEPGIEGRYYLAAAGVLETFRGSSAMLRRLILSSMHELAAQSPLGWLETTVSETDPKLVRILETLGFTTKSRYQIFSRTPR